MNFQVVRILEQNELLDVQAALSRQTFVDGKLTAKGLARAAKNNLQVDRTDPDPTALDQIILNALSRNDQLHAFAYPKRLTLPLFNRYESGMEYRAHVDSPIMGKGTGQIRSDLSLTIFLSDPASYDGGELILEMPFGEQEIKLDAGEAVIYSSTTVHRVAAVTRGVRLAAVGWIQSAVPDERLRAILFDLNKAVKQAEQDGPQDIALLLNKSYCNLLRYSIDL
jgi:PKHD-type hydroxylase